MIESTQKDQQQTRSGQSQPTYQYIKPSQIEIQVIGTLGPAQEQYPKIPQTNVSEKLFCAKCNDGVTSQIQYKMGKGSYCLMILLIICLVTAPLVLVLLCVNSCKDAQHICPKCKSLIGTKQFIFG